MNPIPKIKPLKLSEITADNRLQTRAALNTDVITEYAAAMQDGGKFPPITVYYDRAAHTTYLADGWHRYRAAEQAGLKDILCQIVEDNFDAALRFALGANATHGLKRTNEDKRHTILMAIEAYPSYADRNIAAVCGVSHTMVAAVRQVAENATCPPSERTGKDGKKYPTQRKPKPTPPPSPTCQDCGATVPLDESGICEECRKKLNAGKFQTCQGCESYGPLDESGFCAACWDKISDRKSCRVCGKSANLNDDGMCLVCVSVEEENAATAVKPHIQTADEEQAGLDSPSDATSAETSTPSDSPAGNSYAPGAPDLEPECKREITIQIQGSLNQAHEYGHRGLAHWLLEVERFSKIAMKWRGE